MADQPFKAKRKQTGDSIDYTPSGATIAGTVVVRGGIVGVVNRNLAASEDGAMDVNGVFVVVKDSSVFVDGQSVYWNATGSPVGGTASSGAATSTGGGNTYLGRAIIDDESTGLTGATTVAVLLAQNVSQGMASPTNAITDPGASGAIPVTATGRVPIVTAGAETRTLAAPSSVGQEILIYMKTDGGDCVITCATTINQTGNNTITLNDAGDAIRLIAVEQGSNLRWRCPVNDGCTLTTV